jgi:hypothetical protein
LAHAESKLDPLVLSDGERESLEALPRKRKAAQSLTQRARIVLACAEESGIASLTGLQPGLGYPGMVRTWRSLFQDARLDGLTDAPYPGARRKITDKQVEVLVTRVPMEKAGARTRAGRYGR